MSNSDRIFQTTVFHSDARQVNSVEESRRSEKFSSHFRGLAAPCNSQDLYNQAHITRHPNVAVMPAQASIDPNQRSREVTELPHRHSGSLQVHQSKQFRIATSAPSSFPCPTQLREQSSPVFVRGSNRSFSALASDHHGTCAQKSDAPESRVIRGCVWGAVRNMSG